MDRNRADRGELRDSVSFPGLLAAVGNLSDGHAGHPTFVVALRLKNIVAFAFGKMQAWNLTNDSMTYDPWDYVHITTWNFLPFLLRRVGVAPRWVVNVAFVVWYAVIAALAWTLWRLRKVLRTSEFNNDTGARFGASAAS